MNSIWVVKVEVLAFIDSSPDEGKLGFINVVVAAAGNVGGPAATAAVNAGHELSCRSAIVDGEMIVQDEQGRSDYHGYLKPMT